MSMWDDDAGYDRDDPKHPDWADAMADRADMQRKRAKEEPDPLGSRIADIQAVVTEHTDAEGDPEFVAAVCNGCGTTITAATLEELRPKIAAWTIADGLGGHDFCPSCTS